VSSASSGADGNPPRQIHLLHVFPSFAVGGAQTRMVELANNMGVAYRHTIVALDGDFSCGQRLLPQVSCDFRRVAARKSRRISFRNILAIRRVLSELRPDLLLTHNWGTIEWVIGDRWKAICPQIHFEDGFGSDESVDRQLVRRVLARRIALSGKTIVVVPSQRLYRLVTEGWRLQRDRVHYVPNGILTDRFAVPPDASLLAALGLRGDHPTIGTVAALRREKNLARLIRCFAGLPSDLKPILVIVGEGPERTALETVARDLAVADRVIFAGALTDPARILGAFNVFALSSDTEQMPFTLLEAMAAGLPIVATDVGDVKAVVAPENADHVVHRDDEQGLTAALALLLRDATRRKSLGALNQRRAREKFEQSRMIATYARLFRNAAAV
jgi:glycosyltransferase involved in cell wall biosynthesis